MWSFILWVVSVFLLIWLGNFFAFSLSCSLNFLRPSSVLFILTCSFNVKCVSKEKPQSHHHRVIALNQYGKQWNCHVSMLFPNVYRSIIKSPVLQDKMCILFELDSKTRNRHILMVLLLFLFKFHHPFRAISLSLSLLLVFSPLSLHLSCGHLNQCERH